jgi:hypothetical protein
VVSNAQSRNTHRVAIRGKQPGDNYCACPDYATNELGTCKHIEFVLAALEKKRGAKSAFARGYQPAYSELYLRNNGTRSIHFRAGTDCPAILFKEAALLFDDSRGWILSAQRFGEQRTAWGGTFLWDWRRNGGSVTTRQHAPQPAQDSMTGSPPNNALMDAWLEKRILAESVRKG